MNSMNARFKGFGLSKRKSTANNPNVPQQPVTTTSPQLSGRPGPPSSASTSTASLPQMNQQHGGGVRPPSYTPGYPPGVIGQQQVRTTSPQVGNPRTPPSQMMGGPAPLNTAAAGYPPQQHPPVMGGPPPMQGVPGGPPQYGGPPYPQQQQAGMGAPQPYVSRNNAVEVEGAGRSKSQLIVGIDFVSSWQFHMAAHGAD